MKRFVLLCFITVACSSGGPQDSSSLKDSDKAFFKSSSTRIYWTHSNGVPTNGTDFNNFNYNPLFTGLGQWRLVSGLTKVAESGGGVDINSYIANNTINFSSPIEGSTFNIPGFVFVGGKGATPCVPAWLRLWYTFVDASEISRFRNEFPGKTKIRLTAYLRHTSKYTWKSSRPFLGTCGGGGVYTTLRLKGCGKVSSIGSPISEGWPVETMTLPPRRGVNNGDTFSESLITELNVDLANCPSNQVAISADLIGGIVQLHDFELFWSFAD